MDKEKKTVVSIKKNSKLYVLFGVLFILVGVFLLTTFFKPTNELKVENLYKYTVSRKSDYKVVLKPNNFYDETYLKQDKVYASKSIDNIALNLLYDFKGNKTSLINFSYDVDAEIVGRANNTSYKNDEIWNKKYNLISRKENKQITSQAFIVNQDVKIKYNDYYDLVKAYEKAYGVEIDAYLKVTLNVYFDTTIPKEEKARKIIDSVEVHIPLNDTVTTVLPQYADVSNKEYVDNDKLNDSKRDNYTVLVVGVGCGILGAVLIIISIEKDALSKKAIYKKNLDKVLREYNDLIVTVTNKPNIKNLRPLKLATLEDLVDAAEQNNSNIVHYERIKGEASSLLVITDGYVYTYDITCDDIK